MCRLTPTLPIAFLLLSACQAQDATEDEGRDSPPPVADDNAETVSIMRPDVAPAPSPILQDVELRIGFPDGGSEISEQGELALNDLLQLPQMAGDGAIILHGHSDTAGSDRVNLNSSRERAEAVRDWLVEHGVDVSRIHVIAFGEQNPVQPNALPDGSVNDAGRAANRRVDILVQSHSADPAGAAVTQHAS